MNNTCTSLTLEDSVIHMFFSSFLGFISALLVEALWEKYKSFTQRKHLRSALLDELQNLKMNLLSLDRDKIYIKPYSTPVWNGASKSGSILCLDSDAHFNDFLRFYSLVEESNMIEKEAYEILYINPSADKTYILESVRDSRKLIQDEIDTIIKYLGGE